MVMKDSGVETYGISFKSQSPFESTASRKFWFPTVCKFPEGLRLFATNFLVDAEGIARRRDRPDQNSGGEQQFYSLMRFTYRVGGKGRSDPKSCITVRLTSDPKSTVNAS